MFVLIDQGILFIICSLLFYQSHAGDFVHIAILLSALIFVGLSAYFENKWTRFCLFLTYLGVSVFFPELLYYLPVMIYQPIRYSYRYTGCLGLVLLLQFHSTFSFSSILMILLFNGIAIYLSFRTEKSIYLRTDYNALLDTSRELYLAQVEKNQHVLEDQDYEINLAMLNERNRISKEIHDNIGHLLSRSLLQIAALLTITKDDTTKEVLTDLRDSISSGMDEIRASIHNMHDESIDLYSELYSLIKEFTFCKINFEYDLSNQPELKVKYCFISTLKEALANIVKHSNATDVYVILREHPAFYQFIIDNNGTISSSDKIRLHQHLNQSGEGMGLHNMIDRVNGFHGTIRFNLEHGFQIFMTIPKNTQENDTSLEESK